VRFEALVAGLKTRLAGSTGERVAAEVNRGLEQLLEFFDVDSCGIFEVLRYKKQAYLRHAAHAAGVTVLSTAIDYAEAFPWKSRHVVRLGKVFIMNRVDDFLQGRP
jgi:hypothetical protein